MVKIKIGKIQDMYVNLPDIGKVKFDKNGIAEISNEDCDTLKKVENFSFEIVDSKQPTTDPLKNELIQQDEASLNIMLAEFDAKETEGLKTKEAKVDYIVAKMK